MEKFSMLSLVLLSLLSTRNYVTEARTITTRPVEGQRSDNAIDVNNAVGEQGGNAIDENNAVGEQGGNAIDVNSAAEEQSGYEIYMDSEVDEFINVILDDAAEGDDTERHSVQARDTCGEPSDDELHKMLLAGKFFGQGGDLQDTPDDRFDGEPPSLGCSENLDLPATNKRALCPWSNVWSQCRDDRYPRRINYAKCDMGCKHCGSDRTCQQVLDEQYVLVKGEYKIEDNKYEYTLAKENVPVACVCERSRVE